MTTSADIIIALGLAAALGALIGLERQVGREASDDEYAGLRTFALYSVWGAGAGFLGDQFGQAGFAVGALAFAALLIMEYSAAAKGGDTGTTTEAASFAAFIIGALVWAGFEVAALAAAVGVAALLQSKAWLHGIISRFSDADLRAVLRFGVLTAIVLPLVPDEQMGPFDAINPFEIWLMVVFVAAIGLAGYIALRLLGPEGLAPTGALGGLVSSTAVTLGFSRMSRRTPGVTTALTAGVLAASGIMYVRVLIEAMVVEPEVGRKLIVPVVALFLFVEGVAVWWWWRSRSGGTARSDVEVKNPVTVPAALQFGLLYGVVVFVAKVLIDEVSAESLSVVGALSGINDVDAITLAASNLVADGTVSASIGAEAVLAAVVVNTVVKAAMAAILGSRALAVRVGSVLGIAAVGGAVAWVFV